MHDTLTGLMIASYKVDWGGIKKPASWWRAWREAKPKAQWAIYIGANSLVARAPSASRGPWSIRAQLLRRAKGHKLNPHRGGFKYSWDLKTTRRPTIDVFATKAGGAPRKILRFYFPYRYKWLSDGASNCDEIGGQLRAHWSPDGQRVMLMLHAEASGEGPDGEAGEHKDGRYYLRALGPQISIVCSTAQEIEARKLARRIALAKLPVVKLAFDKTARAATEVYYRRDNAEAARRIAGIIGGNVAVKPRTTRGWLDIIVLLKSAP